MNQFLLTVFYVFFSMIGVMITISSSSPMGSWVGMEIASLFFLPLFFSISSSSVSGWKYFLVQSISSFFLFIGWVVGGLESWVDEFLVLFSLTVKLGLFPFYGWMIHLSENMPWWTFFVLGSLQKVAPLIILSELSDKMSGFELFLSVISGGSLVLLFFSKLSIRWMMMLSSLFNLCWLVVGSSLGMGPLLTYMFIYFLFNFMCISYLSKESADPLTSTYKTRSVSWHENFLTVILFLFLMGIPPMGTFLGKVELVSSLMEEGGMYLSLILVLFSGMVTLFYLKNTYSKGIMSSKVWWDSTSFSGFYSFLFVSVFFLFFWV